ncbi:MAG: type II secretion system F family protein [Actinomycetales bacterium]|nr:type II secretion system F family protein [Actinomycetales bacterium]
MIGVWWLIAALGLSAAGILLASATVLEYQRGLGTRRSLALVDRLGVTSRASAIEGARRPSLVGDIVTSLGSWLVTDRMRASLSQRLALAGKSNPGDLRAAVDRKVSFAVIGVCAGSVVGLRFGGAAWLLAPCLAVGGFWLVDLLLYNAGLKRIEQIRNALPDALDLLNLCVESGLSLQSSLSRVSSHQDGPVAQEFGRVLQEMQLGVARADAFESLARRTQQPDMQRFVSAMLQVDRLGVPVASVLREQASQMRVKRQSRAREQAQKVPVKILAPLLLCFLPGLFIVVLGPAAINVLSIFTNR